MKTISKIKHLLSFNKNELEMGVLKKNRLVSSELE